jgi:predicted O-methyltransferase YrrM
MPGAQAGEDKLKFALLTLPRESDKVSAYTSDFSPSLRHPFYGWLGLRPALAQHTAAEHAALRRWAANRLSLVELGVAEGVSALALREVMAENATLYLIDPFHLSRIPALNFMKRVARKAVGSCHRGSVVWIQKFSHDAVCDWDATIDLLFIDGDHSEAGVERDWNSWSRFVKVGGVAIFHDARIFEGGWVRADYGPLKLVDRFFRNGKAPDWRIAEEVHSLLVVERLR